MTLKRKTNRRQFVGGVAAGSAALMLGRGERAQGFTSANDRPVFATIGLRNQGVTITNKSTKFADFAALADVDSKVLGSNVEKLANRQGKKPDSYGDYRRVLDRNDIDAVMIADRKTDKNWIKNRSIQNNIDKVRVPVLMAYGMEDWRVPPKHGRILKRALDKNDIPNKLIIKANEGHGFRNEKNVFEFYREVESFLAEHMK